MLLAGFVAFAVALLTQPFVLPLLRRLALYDVPGHRSSHLVPTCRGGGIAVVVGLLAGVAVLPTGGSPGVNAVALATAVLAFGVVGLAEDVHGVDPLPRFAFQVVAATVVVAMVTDRSAASFGVAVAATVLGTLWVAAYANAFNFMDGINGISAAQALVAGLYFAELGRQHDLATLTAGGLLAAGSALGFAPWNFPRARVFLGDVGSYAWGALLAVLALEAVLRRLPPEAALAPLLLYLADTGTTLTRRIRAGEPWYLPHRRHAYQRLTSAGWSHTTVTLTVAGLLVACAAAGLAAAGEAAHLVGRLLADAVLAALVLGYLALPGRVARARPPEPVGVA